MPKAQLSICRSRRIHILHRAVRSHRGYVAVVLCVRGTRARCIYALVHVTSPLASLFTSEMEQAPTHTVVHRATVRADAKVNSAEVGTMYPGQHVRVLETVKKNGHLRARVGPGQWVSSRTKLGSNLLVPFAPHAVVHTVRTHCVCIHVQRHTSTTTQPRTRALPKSTLRCEPAGRRQSSR